MNGTLLDPRRDRDQMSVQRVHAWAIETLVMCEPVYYQAYGRAQRSSPGREGFTSRRPQSQL